MGGQLDLRFDWPLDLLKKIVLYCEAPLIEAGEFRRKSLWLRFEEGSLKTYSR